MMKFFTALFVGFITLLSAFHGSPSSSSTVATQTQLNSLATSNMTESLPLGDGKYTITGPKVGYVFLCGMQQSRGGAYNIGNWIHGNTWNPQQKISVSGHVIWQNAEFSNTISGNTRTLSGNDLPVNGYTGTFPIQSTDAAYRYDQNPNTISAHSYTDTFPVNPVYQDTPSCMGGEVGIMLNGVALFNGFDADLRDAAAHELQDSCGGHPQENGEYHYHNLSPCISDINETTVIGFALDGFPITGPQVSPGKFLTTQNLDECHGITSQIILDGKQTTMYHYVMTEDFPYSVSCFRAKPVQMQVIQGLIQGNQNQVQSQSGIQNNTTNRPQPPQAAFTICSGKNSGTSCSFPTPNGTISGTCQTPPNQSSMICVPSTRP